jgi:hypothetical protein
VIRANKFFIQFNMTFKTSIGSTLLCASALCGLFSHSALAQKTDSDGPLVRIGEAASAPKINGKLDDAAWQQSVTVSDFTVVATRQLAAEPTQVKFAYDKQNLYVAWRCEESLLTVAQQRIHEVKTDAKTHDSDVLADDSVLMFLQPAADGVVYEFNLNSIGTLFDSRNKRDTLWASRRHSARGSGRWVLDGGTGDSLESVRPEYSAFAGDDLANWSGASCGRARRKLVVDAKLRARNALDESLWRNGFREGSARNCPRSTAWF